MYNNSENAFDFSQYHHANPASEFGFPRGILGWEYAVNSAGFATNIHDHEQAHQDPSAADLILQSLLASQQMMTINSGTAPVPPAPLSFPFEGPHFEALPDEHALFLPNDVTADENLAFPVLRQDRLPLAAPI
ncbi:hypothetical protein HDU97_004759, partial [Phlyctochytrium planicorne]